MCAAKLREILENDIFESLYEYELKFDKEFRTCEDAEFYRKLPVLHNNEDVTNFFTKLKFVVSYLNRFEISNLLGEEIKDKFKKLDAEAFLSLYYEKLHNWMADRIGTFYTALKAGTFFQCIIENLLPWTIDGLNKAYFAKASQNHRFKKYSILDEFLFGNDQVLHLIFENLDLGRARIVQTFLQLNKEDSTNTRKYTRDFGHIFLCLNDLKNGDFRREVFEVLANKEKYNLLVIESNTQGLENAIQELLEQLQLVLLENGKKIIFITTDNSDVLAKHFKKGLAICDESSFEDLEDNQAKKHLLQKKTITFQEKQKLSLSELLGVSEVEDTYLSSNQDSLNKIICAETLMRLINGKEIFVGVRILKSHGYDDSYYISRRRKAVVLREDKIQQDIIKEKNLRSDFFVISGSGSKLKGYRNIYVFDIDAIELASCKFLELSQQNTESNIHWLRRNSKELTWYKSKGSVFNLIQYRRKEEEVGKTDSVNDLFRKLLKDEYPQSDNIYHFSRIFSQHLSQASGVKEIAETDDRKYDENEFLNRNDKIVIIADAAGTGKSTLLTELALKIKKNNPNVWVIRIKLRSHTKKLEDMQTEKQGFDKLDVNAVVNFLSEQLQLTTNLEKELFINSFNGLGKIALLFDGFDEICPDYKDMVIDLLQVLKESKLEKLFVTTKQNTGALLESKLGVFSFVLQPFSPDCQEDLLIKLWTKKLGLKNSNEKHKKRLKTYAQSLVGKFFSSVKDKKFSSIPLHTVLLGEYFQSSQEQQKVWQGCKEYLDSEEDKTPKLPEELNLCDLYEHFVNKKFNDVFLKEKIARDLSKPGEKRLSAENYETFKKNYEILALYRFREDDVNELLSQNKIEKANRWMKYIERVERNEGIIDEIVDGKPLFTHSNFADYFIANFLAIRLKRQDKEVVQKFVLTNILFKSDFKLLRTFLHEYKNEKKLNQLFWNESMLLVLDIAYSYDIKFTDNDDVDLFQNIIECGDAENTCKLLDALKLHPGIIGELITDKCCTIALDNDFTDIINVLFEHVDNVRLVELLQCSNDCLLLEKLANDPDFDFDFERHVKHRLTHDQIKKLFDYPAVWENLCKGNFEFIDLLTSSLDFSSACKIIQNYSKEVTEALGGSRDLRDSPHPDWYVIKSKYLDNSEEEYHC